MKEWSTACLRIISDEGKEAEQQKNERSMILQQMMKQRSIKQKRAEAAEESIYKLPTNLKPSLYELTIKPYFTATTEPSVYDGHVAIRFGCVEDTSKLVLHMRGLQIDNSSLKLIKLNENSQQATATPPQEDENNNIIRKNFEWSYDAKLQFFVADFGSNIFVKGSEYVVHIGFRGALKQDNYGLYTSSYKTSSGAKR